MGPINDPRVLAYDLPMRSYHDPCRIDPQAYAMIGERCRHAVPVAIKSYEASRRYPFAMLNEAVKGTTHWH